MKLTVVFDDKIIAKDGVIYEVDAEDWSLTQGNMHAVQWQDTSGHLEFTDNTANQALTSESQVATYSTFFDNYHARQISLNSIDQTYYTVGALDESTNTYAAVPKDLATLKAERIATVKTEANSRLKGLDWYIIRYLELGAANPSGAIPSAVTTYRAAVRSASNTACTAITNAADFNAVIALSEPSWPADLDATTYYY
jgi:hypothetical protein